MVNAILLHHQCDVKQTCLLEYPPLEVRASKFLLRFWVDSEQPGLCCDSRRHVGRRKNLHFRNAEGGLHVAWNIELPLIENVDHCIRRRFTPASKEGCNERILGPIEKPGWQTMVLSQGQPLPIVLRNVGYVGNGPLFELLESSDLIDCRERTPTACILEVLPMIPKAASDPGQQGKRCIRLATEDRRNSLQGPHHVMERLSPRYLVSIHQLTRINHGFALATSRAPQDASAATVVKPLSMPAPPLPEAPRG